MFQNFPFILSSGNRQRVEDCRDHPYMRPNPFLGPPMNGLRLAPGGMEPVGAGAADPRMGLNTPPDMCPGCKYTAQRVCIKPGREGGREKRESENRKNTHLQCPIGNIHVQCTCMLYMYIYLHALT